VKKGLLFQHRNRRKKPSWGRLKLAEEKSSFFEVWGGGGSITRTQFNSKEDQLEGVYKRLVRSEGPELRKLIRTMTGGDRGCKLVRSRAGSEVWEIKIDMLGQKTSR